MDRRTRVLLDPFFRSVAEILSDDARRRLDEIADVVWARDEPMPADRFRDELPDVDVVVFGEWRHGPLRPESDAPRLRAVLEVAGGHHHPTIGYGGLLEAGVQVGSCAPAFVPAVAEMGLALALASVRGVARADRSMRDRTDRWLHDGNASNRSLFGATVGFLGCGGIATELNRLIAPFGSDVFGFDPSLPVDEIERRGFVAARSREVVERCDVVFVLLAPTAEALGLVDDEHVRRMKTGQHVVVLSRSSVIDLDAVARRVEEGSLHLASDVFDEEPLSDADHLRDLDRTVLTPHIAGALPSALRSIGESVVDDIESISRGETPRRMQYLDSSNISGLVQPVGD